MSSMEEKIVAAEKEALVSVVKMTQRQGMRGAKGEWKEFLKFHDRKMGDSICDPAKRSVDDLVAFLKTFSDEEDLKFIANIVRCHSSRKAVQQLPKSSTEIESPQQRLVRLTLTHPEYLLNYAFPSQDEGWLVTKLRKASEAEKSNSMVAVDCEMVLCQDGTEAVIQVCVVDQNLEVKLNELVNPNKAVTDYRTEITGISIKDLEGVTCSLADIQRKMKKLLRHGTILVGHGLSHDMRVLKVDHARVIDTSLIFKYQGTTFRQKPSLNGLCKSVLGCEVRKEGSPHNCLDDARAAMKLVLANLEPEFTGLVAWDSKEVPEHLLTKLLLHSIPLSVPLEDLKKVFPDFPFELQLKTKLSRKRIYSAVAVFKNPQEAHEAFESIKGDEEMDNSGRSQKIVSFEPSTGLPATFRICKWEVDTTSKKRPVEDANKEDSKKPSKKRSVEENKEESKKQETDSSQCELHSIEIDRLKRELRQRNDEIVSLQKIIAALTRKQGL